MPCLLPRFLGHRFQEFCCRFWRSAAVFFLQKKELFSAILQFFICVCLFERLDIQFTFEQAMQHSVAVKGANVNHNTVRQMLKNWRKQRLVVHEDDGNYRKL